MQWIVLFASGDNGERDGMCTSRYIVIQPQETHMELNRTMFNTCVEIESLSLLLGTCQ